MLSRCEHSTLHEAEWWGGHSYEVQGFCHNIARSALLLV